jgi:RNA polymerase-binding transcription factor DksA
VHSEASDSGCRQRALSFTDEIPMVAFNIPSAPASAMAIASAGVVITPMPACWSGYRHPNMSVKREGSDTPGSYARPCVIDAGRLLEEHRERTVRRVRELTDVFDEIVASSDTANLDDEHDPEGATVAFERTQVAALLERARAQLAELDDARARVERGTYGVCERCARPIPAERLEAQPAARRCVVCADGISSPSA